MTNRRFLTFEETEGSYNVLDRATLTVKAQGETGLGNISSTLNANPGTYARTNHENWIIDANGFSPNNGPTIEYDYREALTTAQANAFYNQGQIEFDLVGDWSPDAIVAENLSSNFYIISRNGTNLGGWIEVKNTNGLIQNKWFNDVDTGAGGSVATNSGAQLNLTDATGLLVDGARYTLTWDIDEGYCYTYIDGFMVEKLLIPAGVGNPEDVFSNVFVGLTSLTTNNWGNRSIKNLVISYKPQILDNTPKILHIGDSITSQGSHGNSGSDGLAFLEPDEVATGSRKLPWGVNNHNNYQQYGYESGTTNTEERDPGTMGFEGQVLTIYKNLMNNGIYPIVDNKSIGHSGARISKALEHVSGLDSFTVGFIEDYQPDIAISLLGTNDVASGVALNTTDQINDYKEIISRVYDKGATKMFVVEIPSLVMTNFSNNGGNASLDWSEADHVQKRIDLNDEIKSLPAWADANGMKGFVTFVKLPDSLSSDSNYDPNLFKESGTNIHPNEAGQTLLGQTISNAIVNSVLDKEVTVTDLAITIPDSGYMVDTNGVTALNKTFTEGTWHSNDDTVKIDVTSAVVTNGNCVITGTTRDIPASVDTSLQGTLTLEDETNSQALVAYNVTLG
jgi:hypothetical protein